MTRRRLPSTDASSIRQTPAMVAEVALQEDVDVIGVSILSGAHLELFPRLIEELRARGIGPENVILLAGGIIPRADYRSATTWSRLH